MNIDEFNFNKSYGTFYNFGESDYFLSTFDRVFPCSEIYQVWEREYWNTCFTSYWRKVNSSKFYFAFPVLPPWYDKLVGQFNQEFKNIKIEIVKEKPIYIYIHDLSDKNPIKISPERTDSCLETEYKCPLFLLNFSEEYSYSSRRILQFMLSIFLRLMNLTENVRFISIVNDPGGDYIQYLLDCNNKAKEKYRSFCEDKVDKEVLLLFDNPKLINYITNKTDLRYSTQTQIIKEILSSDRTTYKIKVKEADKYLINDFYTKLIGKRELEPLFNSIISSRGKTFRDRNTLDNWYGLVNHYYPDRFEIIKISSEF